MKIKHLIYALLLVGFTGCGEFDDLNVDPNNPVSVQTGTLITSAQRSMSDAVGSSLGALYAQHISDIIYTEGGRYQSIVADFSAWYSGPLQNLQTVIDLNTDPATSTAAAASGSNANQIALARILKAYFFHFLTDRWGALPYSEALKARSGIYSPKYDSQEAIYDDLLKELKEAVAQIDGGAGVKGDIIFDGDMDSWKRFANTLRMNIALRMADVSNGKAQSEFNDAIAAGVITADVFYPYLGEANNENPWFASFRTRTDFAVTEHLVDYLKATNDPRLPKFADPTLNSVAAGNPIYTGMPYGVTNPTSLPPDVSYPNSTYAKCQDCPLPIYTVAQVNFAKAEAAARGWGGGSAEDHFRAAIQASWNQWDVSYTAGEFDTYYNQANVKWDAGNWKASLAQQKWVGLFIQGYEGWAEWRRLNGPTFVVPAEPLNPSGGIPLRNIYPTTEASLNGVNYAAAVTQFLGGSDSDGVRLWWDVN
ncbi:MAG: SusD/RagB family nutrient-binding outer membrane lipoprotein [Saprospiraceae bacterium]